MNQIKIHFHYELNDFLSEERKEQEFLYSFKGNPSVKHLVEALRIPHTEVGEIFVNGDRASLSYLVRDGDRLRVFPAHSPSSSLDECFPGGGWNEQSRFILDNHLGKLATYLRLLGFDVLYKNDYEDEKLVEEALTEERILLTRDRGLLMRRIIQSGYCIRNLDPRLQLIEVLRRYDLFDKIQPFQRCLRCNYPLQPIKKDVILGRLKPLTRLYYDEFHICNQCDQIYWKGSHYQRMEKFLKTIKEQF